LGFLFQYYLIWRRQAIGSFSIKACGILLLSGNLRLGFYLVKPYSLALLCQTLLMMTVQVPFFLYQASLLILCLKVMHKEGYFQDKPENGEQEAKPFKQRIWKWRNKSKYGS
jgi:hypothetical protein